ncbi:sigma 54-interacting transcriptional regulator, partial [Klebsiella pneumoniae]|nr:sigma 54-interacting transcriptional regulator [Klebsiella pneumoniae]
DVRVLAASNTNLRRAVSERRFREDLLYRLRVVELHMPALRERLSDIPLLLEHFIAKICNRESMAIKRFEPAVIDHLSA